MLRYFIVCMLIPILLLGCTGGVGPIEPSVGGETVVVIPEVEEELVLPEGKEYTLSVVPGYEEEVGTPADAPMDNTWISPGKVWIGDEPGREFYPGARAEWPITIHNGKDKPVTFLITSRAPARTLDGYARAPSGFEGWIGVANLSPELQAKETRDILVVLEIPKGVKVDEDKWEFWIVVRDTEQAGMVQVELAIRWLVSMR